MAVGDLTQQVFATADTFVTFTPTGSNGFLCLSFGSKNQGTMLVNNGVSESVVIEKDSDTETNGYVPNNIKIPIDNTNYLRVYGDEPTNVGMAQTA